jgi:hypothetical protein
VPIRRTKGITCGGMLTFEASLTLSAPASRPPSPHGHRPRGFLSLQPRTPLFPSLSPHRPGLAPSTADAGMASTCTGTLMKAASWIWPCTNLVTEPFGHPCFTWGLARVPLSYLILKIKLDIKPYVCLGINHTHIKTN